MSQVICPNPECIFHKNKIPQIYRETGCMKCETPLPKPKEVPKGVEKQKPPPKPLTAQEWDDAYISLCFSSKKYRAEEGWKGGTKAAVGISAVDIYETALKMFPAGVSDGDHPKGQLRSFRISHCLYYRLCLKS